MEITKTSRVLSVYHLFRTCEEVSFQEPKQQLGASEKTFLRDIRLLTRAGCIRERRGSPNGRRAAEAEMLSCIERSAEALSMCKAPQ